MSSQIIVTTAGGSAKIHIDGRFDFHMQREFRSAYTPVLQDESIRTIEVELSKVNYLDSSALGMLMLLRERSQELGKVVALVSPTDTVRKIFVIAKFDKLFKLD